MIYKDYLQMTARKSVNFGKKSKSQQKGNDFLRQKIKTDIDPKTNWNGDLNKNGKVY